MVFKPIKETINVLESKTANLADCFIGLVKLAATIKRLSNDNFFKPFAITCFNRRYQQFDCEPYLLTYYLHPQYRGNGLKNGQFRTICTIAAKYWANLGHTDQACTELISQLRRYKCKEEPFDFIYNETMDTPIRWWNTCEDEHEHLQNLALKMFAITPSQASCERNFSTLKWLYGFQRTCLGTERLESMTKIRSYSLSNTQKVLRHYGKALTEEDLRLSALADTVYAELEFTDIEELLSNNSENVVSFSSEDNQLDINNTIDLNNAEFNGSIIRQETREINNRRNEVGSLDYDPEALVNSIVAHDE